MVRRDFYLPSLFLKNLNTFRKLSPETASGIYFKGKGHPGGFACKRFQDREGNDSAGSIKLLPILIGILIGR